MSSIVVAGDTSGTCTLQAPAVAGSTVLTLPAVSGTVITNTAGVVTQAMLSTNVAGNGPAFSATIGSAQAITLNTTTKIAYSGVEFDTNSNYNGTLYRYTPTVAGYYQVSGGVQAAAAGQMELYLYKNGSFARLIAGIPASTLGVWGSSLVSMNGSTDYIELYVRTTVTTTLINSGAYCYFQAAMVRSA